MPEGKIEFESLIASSKKSGGMNLFDSQKLRNSNKIRPKSFQRKNVKGAIWAICILFLICIPYLFPFFASNPSAVDSYVEETNDEVDPEILPDYTLTFQAKEAIKPRNIPQISGTKGFSGTSYPIGDWFIDGIATVWNETIVLDGDLIVNGTGSLYFMNVTLIMNCSTAGQYKIEVMGGGQLYIWDNDWDRLTMDDGSNITAYDPYYKYLFWIQKDSYFEMRNSNISWCGYEWGTNGKHSGLWINTNNTVITGNHITKMRNGIVYFESNNNTLENNTIRNNYFNGLYIRSSSNNNIFNNSIDSNKLNSLYIIVSSNNNSIVNNRLFNNLNHGVRISGSNYNAIIDNDIYSNSIHGIVIVDKSSNNSILQSNVYLNKEFGVYLSNLAKNNMMLYNEIYSNSDHGLAIVDRSSNNIISNNSIHSNQIDGIKLRDSCDENMISDNYIYNNNKIGLHLSTSSNNIISNNSIYSNQIDGIKLSSSCNENIINYNYIHNNTKIGLHLSSSSNNDIMNNKIYNNSVNDLYLGGIYLTSSTQNNILNNIVNSNKCRGIYLLSGSGSNNIINNVVHENLRHGIVLLDSNYNNISKNLVYNNSDYGIAIASTSDNNILDNNTIFSNSKYGIYISSSCYTKMKYCNISYFSHSGLYLTSSSKNNIIENSSITGSSGYDFHLTSDSNLLSINTSFDKSKSRIDDAGSILTVQWYLHIKVTNLIDEILENVSITIKDNQNGAFEETFITNSWGYIKWITITEFIKTSTTITYFTPHNFSFIYNRYVTIYQGFIDPEPIIDRSMTLLIKINVPGNYISMYPGWNLISIPYIEDSSSIIEVLSPIEYYYDAIQWYNSTDVIDHWKQNYISKPSIMNDFPRINHKMGFWIHINHSNGIGLIINKTNPNPFQPIELYKGWNLVGYPTIINKYRDIALNNLQFGPDIKIIQYYDSFAESWETLDIDEKMQNGIGYWIYANLNLTWNVNTTIPPIHNVNRNLFYWTIQDAIDQAEDMDVINIAQGLYREDVSVNKSVTIEGSGKNRTKLIGLFNITSNNVKLSSFELSNSSFGLILNNVSKVDISNIQIYNCTYGAYIDSSTEINFENIFINDLKIQNQSYAIFLNNSNNCDFLDITISNSSYGIYSNFSREIGFESCDIFNSSYGIYASNLSNLYLINLTITNNSIDNIQMYSSNVTLLNGPYNVSKINFLDTDSYLTIQWFLHISTKDQLGIPIEDVTIEVTDNENGTFIERHVTDQNGHAYWIAVTERIQNKTGNISFNPHTATTDTFYFSFYNDPCEIIINKTTYKTLISINTVNPTSIQNVNRWRFYLTIEEAIDDANQYNTIKLFSGTYTENIRINKPLTLLGENNDSTFLDGKGDISVNITSNNVILSNLNIQNSSYGIYFDSCETISISNIITSNNTYGIYIYNSSISSISELDIQDCIYGLYINNCGEYTASDIIVLNNSYGIYINKSSPTFSGFFIENNTYGLLGFNSTFLNITDSILKNADIDFFLSDSYFLSLNNHFNDTKIKFQDISSNLTVKWYLHVFVEDVNNFPIPDANIWIRDNENGTFDQNYTTGLDGYVRWIILIERIQNQSGNISFNPYIINVTYWTVKDGWFTFNNNPRNVSINGSLFEIRTESFVSLEAIPEFSHILAPIIAITASFVLFRKKGRKTGSK
jgi:parallel beta-helix repeat protein